MANINQEVENAATRFSNEMPRSEKKNGCFRPTRSANWAHTMFPTSIPAIWIEAIALGTQALSHTRFH
ncbi:hypothetical protein DPMN_124135 [Dreissena polymorpha]|uniref:Uncharacterized protein n=1 Tax=Dreissena polymorpha TaxID=45954 RepID=A0A9D4GSY7_DREPO|nr:hypothetical protein DPMN_124135 [Dreissena polymorpha]